MNFGTTLKELRKGRKISQEDMASILNVSRQTISSWENSKSYPDITLLIKISSVYKISIDNILKNDKELLTSIKKNSIQKRKIILISVSIISILTIILIYIVFLNNYSKESIDVNKHINTLIKNKEKFIQIEKSSEFNQDVMTDNYIKITDSDFKDISKRLKRLGYSGKGIYRFTNYHIASSDTIGYISLSDIIKINPTMYENTYTNTNPLTYWTDQFDIVAWDKYDDFIEKDIIGKKPTNSKEIMISNVLANLIINYGIKAYDKDYYYKPQNYKELVSSNEYFYFGIDKIKIVGIIDYNLKEFSDIKNITWEELNKNYDKYSKSNIKFSNNNTNIYNKIYVNTNFINDLKINDSSTIGSTWQRSITRVGILVLEDTKNGFKKLINEFDKKPFCVKSTYEGCTNK